MATPVGHSLFGLVVGQITGRRTPNPGWRWYLLAVLSANAPDFDFIPGLLLGDVNGWHHGASHSIIAAFLVGLLATVTADWFKVGRLRVAVMVTGAYLSHLLLDWLCQDNRAPFGIPLFWPFTDRHYIAPYTLFSGVKHGVPGDSLGVFLTNVFSWHNIVTLMMEVLALVPFVLIAWVIYYRNSRPADKRYGNLHDQAQRVR